MPDQSEREAEAVEAPPAFAPDSYLVVYIHGIGNKPSASTLKCQWDNALFGVDMGDRTRMAYWVNRRYYPSPLPVTCATGDLIDPPERHLSEERVRALGEERALEAEVERLAGGDAERERILRGIKEKMTAKEMLSPKEIRARGVEAEDLEAKVLPVPPFLRRWVTREITRTFLRDVNDFFFDGEARKEMKRSLRERLAAGGGPFVVVAHSQGTMIAYDVLRELPPDDYDVRLFVTIGSPLGIEEVQDVFHQWAGKPLPIPACVKRWVNVAAWLDPVSADMALSDEFSPERRIKDHRVWNTDGVRYAHSGTGYLRTAEVRGAVRATVGTDFAQAVSRFVLSRDLVEDLEDKAPEERHPVLIQLAEPDGSRGMSQVREALIASIKDKVGDEYDQAKVDPLRRFLAARLTRSEVEELAAEFESLHIDKVWRDARRTALIHESTQTVQARPANIGYDATGRNIRWGVLDTGIRRDHPHFAEYDNIEAEWDCTQVGPPQEGAPDGDGHGTHVAGTICGSKKLPLRKGEPPVLFAGMAPEARLHVYKVLDDNGSGQDSWIIKALDHVAQVNEQAGELVIHGVNVSLGGSYDPSVYGCGHSPICEEIRRLWRQGVLVCLAAGNEGYVVFEAATGEVQANMDLSIGDPANLEEAIAVGSVHKTNPHTYGVSYFSSRGPTADGRRKPDVVAPGERVVSAAHNFKDGKKALAGDLYVEMSGTSMATPHVSGMLAAFLSRHTEFIGYPDQVKSILLDNCTDLRRDPYMQGAGLPNLIRMLANT